MALKPVLKVKVDELFLRWLSEPETQQALRENLQQIAHGEALTQPSPRSMMHRPNSPRHRPGSPTLSTSASKLPSPRSPRRPLSTKNNHMHAVITSNDGKLAVPNGNQKDLHHGVLREKEPQPFDKDVSHGDHLRLKDSPAAFKDSKSGARTTTPTTTTTSATITLSPPSSSSSTTIPTLSRQEDKENKPKTRDLPLPRMPLKVRSEDIPPFHFPLGKPESDMDVDAIVEKATAEFAKLEGGKAYKQQIGHIAKIRLC